MHIYTVCLIVVMFVQRELSGNCVKHAGADWTVGKSVIYRIKFTKKKKKKRKEKKKIKKKKYKKNIKKIKKKKIKEKT